MRAKPCDFRSKSQFQRQLHLPRGEGIGDLHRVGWHLKMAGEVVDSNLATDLFKVYGVAGQTVLGDGHQLVVAVEQIEGFHYQVNLQTISNV